MAVTKADKIAQLATKRVTGEFRVTPFPKLSELCTTYGFKDGMRRFEEETEKWRVELEKSLNERGINAPEIPASES